MDKEDFKIVLLLMINSRLTYRDVAEHLGLSVNAVYKRMNTLVNLGIIQRFTAKIKPSAINAIYAFIYGKSENEDNEQLEADLGKHPNTAHILFSSRNYLYIGSFLKNIHELDDYSSFISNKAQINSPQIGFLSGVYSASPIPYIHPKIIPGTLTNLDKAIIRSLHKDSRKPLAEIAKEVRSTPNTVSRRLNKLIEEGIL